MSRPASKRFLAAIAKERAVKVPRLSLKPNHAAECEEDHDHLLLDGKEIARFEYGDIDRREIHVTTAKHVRIEELLPLIIDAAAHPKKPRGAR